MAALANKKIAGGGFSNAAELVRVTYDFAVDGGATGSLDVLEAEVPCVVKLRHAAVKTAVTSAGSLTLSLGAAIGGTGLLDTVGVGALTVNSVHTPDDPDDIYLGLGSKIDMTIGGAAATAGKVEFIFEIVRF